MNTITDLKKNSLKRVQEIAVANNETPLRQKIGIKNYEVVYKFFKLTVYNTGQYLLNHLLLNIELDTTKPNGFYHKEDLTSGVINVFGKYFEEIMHYFENYARFKEKEGIILRFSGNLLPEELHTSLRNYFNTEEIYNKFLSNYIQKGQFFYLGAVLSNEFKKKIDNYLQSTSTIYEVLKKDKLLTAISGSRKFSFPFGDGPVIAYHGEVVQLSITENYDTLEMRFDDSDKAPIYVDVVEKKIMDAFYQIAEENRMKNLLNHPKVWFELYMKTMVKVGDKERINLAFDKFMETFESWEMIEKMFMELSQNEAKPTKIMDTSDVVLDRRIVVRVIPYESYYFYFIKAIKSMSHSIEVVISQSENPIELSQFVFQHMYGSLISVDEQ